MKKRVLPIALLIVIAVIAIFFLRMGDPRAVGLLDSSQAKLASIQSLSTDCTYTISKPEAGQSIPVPTIVEVMHIQLMRPNYARFDSSIDTYSNWTYVHEHVEHMQTDVADGHVITRVISGKSYGTQPDNLSSVSSIIGFVNPIVGFFDPSRSMATYIHNLQRLGFASGARVLENQTWDGATYKVARFDVREPGSSTSMTQEYFIGDDMLIHHIHAVRNDGVCIDYSLRNVKINDPMTLASFASTPQPTPAVLTPVQ